MNPHCECPVAGWCKRHQIEKDEVRHSLCRGTAGHSNGGLDHWLAWEKGRLKATAPDNPVLEVDWVPERLPKAEPPPGEPRKIVAADPTNPRNKSAKPKCRVGTAIKKLIAEKYRRFGLAAPKGCTSCGGRASAIDAWSCDECRTKLDEIVKLLLEGAKEQKLLRPLVAVLPGTMADQARQLAMEAIESEELRLSAQAPATPQPGA